MSFIPVTERTLRAAMREPRYWQDGHPERGAFHAWVFQGWRDLVASPHRTADGAGVAFVRAYTRVRNGRTEHVGAHTRSTGAREGGSRPSESSGHDTSARDDQWPDVVPIMGRRPSWLFGGRRAPSPPEGTPGGGGTSRGGTGQSQPSTRRQTTPETDSGATLRPSPRTPEELRATAPQERRTSSSRIYNRGGGEAQRDADFQALGPIRTERDERGVVTGYLPDGRRIVSRPSTQDRERRPTLELQRPDGKVTDKFRY